MPDKNGEPQPLLVGAEGVLALADAFLASAHVVRLTDGDDPLYSTAEMTALQDRIVARFARGLNRGAHVVSDRHLRAALGYRPHLTAEQRSLVTSWCQSGHRFQTAIGRAAAAVVRVRAAAPTGPGAFP